VHTHVNCCWGACAGVAEPRVGRFAAGVSMAGPNFLVGVVYMIDFAMCDIYHPVASLE
jgi:hypothetical protein